MTKRLFMAIVCFSCCMSCAAYATVEAWCQESTLCVIKVSGLIAPEDAEHFQRSLERFRPPIRVVFYLDSHGGDVDVAMAIGRKLRERRGIASVPGDMRCVSACVLVLAGATVRAINGPVGIHRMYSSSTAHNDYKSLQDVYRKMEIAVKTYLKEMNVSEALYDAMMRIPSEKVRALSRSEMDFFGLTADDPVSADLLNSREANKYGLTKDEYLKRKGEADATCNRYVITAPPQAEEVRNWISCQETIFTGR